MIAGDVAQEQKKRIRLKFRARLNRSQWRTWQSQDRWTAFLGGWGSGKTFLGARAFLRNVVENPPGVDALLVGPYWSTVRRTTLREFKACCPRQLITAESKQDRFIEVLGRRVYYGSADNPETLDGPTVGAAWIDEGRYVSRDGWRVVSSRLRSKKARQVRGFITSTPGGPWLQEEFGTGKPNRTAIHASTRENAANLADGTIEDMEQSLSARAAKIYIDGQFGLLEGAVYDFEKARHLIPWTYDPRLPVVIALDFGFTRPAVLFLQPIPAGRELPPWRHPSGALVRRHALPGTWVIFDELVPDLISTEQLLVQVKAKPYRYARVVCDPAGDGTQPAFGISDVKLVKQALGVPVQFQTEPRLRHIPFGVRVLQAMLGNVAMETRLFVAQQVEDLEQRNRAKVKRGVVLDFCGYCYPEAKDGRPVTDQPLKDGLTDHTMDAARYFAVHEAVSGGVFPSSIQIR